MFQTLLGTAGHVLLSLTLLVNGLAMPAFQHAHDGGDKPHDHEASVEHSHSHDHDCAEHHHHHGTRDPRLLTNSVAHVHVSCFGFEFSLPLQDESEHSDLSNSGSIAFVKPHDECLQAPPAVNAILYTLLMPHVIQSSGILPIVGHFSFRPADSIPLCDTARHERSGVQLA